MEKTHSEYKKLHIATYPWFAFGHYVPFLNLSNKLASRGHKISIFLPKKASSQLAVRNCYPNHITFIPLTLITVDGLPLAVETLSDRKKLPLLWIAMDLTQPKIDSLLSTLKPDIVLFDYAYWLPRLASQHKIKTVYFSIAHISIYSYLCLMERPESIKFEEAPPGFPCSEFQLEAYEAKRFNTLSESKCGLQGLTFYKRMWAGVEEANAICFKGCREMDGHYGEYFEKQYYGKPLIWAGPGLPDPQDTSLDEKMEEWLQGFEKGSVVYCALGSESMLEKDQFQELLLGLELTALPEGFAQRTEDRGAIHSWVQQELILKHPSVGCFVTHWRSSSLTESLISDCRLVLLPVGVDHSLQAMVMSLDFKIGIRVKRAKDGFFTKDDVHQAIMKVHDPNSKVGDQLRKNHAKWRDLLKEGFEEFYINNFVQSLQNLLE